MNGLFLKGAELLQKISRKNELGCRCTTGFTLEDRKVDRKEDIFWEILGGRQKPKGILYVNSITELCINTKLYSWVLYCIVCIY